jgi:A/G-specific adenine glycosylase
LNPALSSDLLAWYRLHARDLPWRNTHDPYRIWLSEIILQQTRVDQGRPYYERFTERFPTLKDLAQAQDEEVMKIWEGLGYYSRARNLLKAARLIQQAYNGRFPNTAEGLGKLPGIGPYTSAAIASFAFGQVIGVVDGNVFRLLSRLFDIDSCIDEGKNRPVFQALADELIDKEVPGISNQALMEFGATICTPRPKCQKCPLQTHCLARERGTIDLRPVRKKRNKVKEETIDYLILLDGSGQMAIQQRPAQGIWAELFEPLHSAEHQVQPKMDQWCIDHRLTHRILHIHFQLCRLKTEKKPMNKGIIWIGADQRRSLAFPVPVLKAFAHWDL